MSFVGFSIQQFEYIVYIIVTIIAGLLCLYQCIFLQEMKILPVYMLPFLSFCICFEYIVLMHGDGVQDNSITAAFACIFHSFEVPLFVATLFETSYRLHEARSAHFFCIPFDQGSDLSWICPATCLGFVRIFACGLFVLNILLDFEQIPGSENYFDFQRAGYMYLARHKHSLSVWMSLVPSISLSIVALAISMVSVRYGNNLTIGLQSRSRWKLLAPCSLAYVVSQIFLEGYYMAATSLGVVILLFGTTFLLQLVQEDLSLAGSFADYLHSSNVAFSHVPPVNNAEEIPIENDASTGKKKLELLMKSRKNLLDVEEDRSIEMNSIVVQPNEEKVSIV